MNYEQQNPELELKSFGGETSIYFTFKGKLTEKNAVDAINQWKKLLAESNKPIIHIWNCNDMTGYEPMARIIWQKTMKENKDKIGKIWLISNSSTVLAGAKILSVFTSFSVKTVGSEGEIVV